VDQPVPSVAYFDSTFTEALALARDARDYFAYREPTDAPGMDPVARLAASCEAMRLTSRVTQIMAWLLVQKAVHAGELSRTQAARPEYRLGGHAVCQEQCQVADLRLPEALEHLLARSRGMYDRIARLDAMFDEAER